MCRMAVIGECFGCSRFEIDVGHEIGHVLDQLRRIEVGESLEEILVGADRISHGPFVETSRPGKRAGKQLDVVVVAWIKPELVHKAANRVLGALQILEEAPAIKHENARDSGQAVIAPRHLNDLVDSGQADLGADAAGVGVLEKRFHVQGTCSGSAANLTREGRRHHVK